MIKDLWQKIKELFAGIVDIWSNGGTKPLSASKMETPINVSAKSVNPIENNALNQDLPEIAKQNLELSVTIPQIAKEVPVLDTLAPIIPTIQTIAPKPPEIANISVVLPKWQEKEQNLIKALIILENRANNWDLKLIYSWCHLESGMWDDKAKKMYPFSNPITLEGSNYLGIKRSSIWDKVILNPLDRQLYCRFEDANEFIGFLDLFLKRGYPDAYKERTSYKLFYPLLRQGKYGAFCPRIDYADECFARYNSLPVWETILKKSLDFSI
jgi:hypothetical protein